MTTPHYTNSQNSIISFRQLAHVTSPFVQTTQQMSQGITKAELLQVGFFCAQFPSLGFFIIKKVGDRKN